MSRLPAITCTLSAALALAGCTGSRVNQGPLLSDARGAAPAPAARSLVIGARPGAGEGSIAGRNDAALGVRPSGMPLYYGPDGRLLYPDGTPVPFKGVLRQLQTLQAEQRAR